MELEKLSEQFGILLAGFIVALGGYLLSEMKAFFAKKQLKRKENFVFQARKDKYIDDLLVEIRAKFDAACVCVYQLHNGTQYKGGDPIKFYSMSHEKPMNFVRTWKENSQRLLLYDINQTFLQIVENKLVQIRRTEPADYQLAKIMMVREYAGIVLVYLEGEKNIPLGFMELSYVNDFTMLSEKAKKELLLYGKEVSYKLNE